jgi:hypothetical protein
MVARVSPHSKLEHFRIAFLASVHRGGKQMERGFLKAAKPSREILLTKKEGFDVIKTKRSQGVS